MYKGGELFIGQIDMKWLDEQIKKIEADIKLNNTEPTKDYALYAQGQLNAFNEIKKHIEAKNKQIIEC